jgi:iron complex outermembrane receptor protein
MNATLASANTPTDAANHNIPTFTLTEDPNDSKANYYSDRYIEDGSFVRLDNATLSYQFKLNSKNIKGLRIYVTSTNLFIITKYTGTDPELDLGGISSPGVDSNNYYPRTRSFSTGVQIDL